MGTLELVRTVAADQDRTFAVLGDLAAYGDYQPLTRIRATPGPIGVGWSFVGLTGVGPLSIVDRMVVTDWDPGQRFEIVKLGPVLDGGARVHLMPEGDSTRVVWQEEVVPRPGWLGARLRPGVDAVMRWFLGAALDRMTERIEAR